MRLRLGILVVLLVLVVGSLATVGGLALSRHGNPFSSVDKTQRTREAVMSQARQFMLRVNTYGPSMLQGTTMPKYRTQVEAVITAKLKADFLQNVQYAEAPVAQLGVDRTTKVYAVGVSDIDDTRATALVTGEFTSTYPAKKGSTKRVPTNPESYRVQVTLDKVHGTWLVDSYDPVQDQQTGSSSGTTPAPSAEPSLAVPSASASGSAQ